MWLGGQVKCLAVQNPPPHTHTTHHLQPLDIGIFGPLQCAWQKQCLEVMDETGQGVTWQQLVKEYMKACTNSIKESVILNAWKKTGIRPFDSQIFKDDDFGPSFASSTNQPLPHSFPVPDTNSDLSRKPAVSSSDGSSEEDSDGRDSKSEERNAGKDVEEMKQTQRQLCSWTWTMWLIHCLIRMIDLACPFQLSQQPHLVNNHPPWQMLKTIIYFMKTKEVTPPGSPILGTAIPIGKHPSLHVHQFMVPATRHAQPLHSPCCTLHPL